MVKTYSIKRGSRTYSVETKDPEWFRGVCVVNYTWSSRLNGTLLRATGKYHLEHYPSNEEMQDILREAIGRDLSILLRED